MWAGERERDPCSPGKRNEYYNAPNLVQREASETFPDIFVEAIDDLSYLIVVRVNELQIA